MKSDPIFESCLLSLMGCLERARQASEGEALSEISAAETFAGELRTLSLKSHPKGGDADHPNAVTSDSDPTDYLSYSRLREAGFNPAQLVAVADSQDLHELRILRMLRTVVGMDLEAAKEQLARRM